MCWSSPGAGERPSVTLRRGLTGDLAMQDAPEAIQSWARLEIYTGAKAILAMPFSRRKSALQNIPESVRPYVQKEMIRLHNEKKARR